MDLRTFLELRDQRLNRAGVELNRVATAAKASPYTLYMIALGHKLPSAAMARRIADATAGEVTVNHLRPDIFGPAVDSKAA